MGRRSDIERRKAAIARQHPVRRAIGAAVLLLLSGTCGYMWLEGWDLGRALYFTVITLSTVGYGDYGLSDVGMRFTTLLILGGLGVTTYAISRLAPLVLNHDYAREWKMKRELYRLTDHSIVCGLGPVGRSVCISLAQQDLPFVGIDPDERLVRAAIEAGHLAIAGDAGCDDVLIEAGVERARSLACVAGIDAENIVITLGARHLNPDLLIVSCAEEASSVARMERAGASRVLSPIRAGGRSIANTMIHPIVEDLLRESLDVESGIRLTEVAVGAGSSLDARTIHECGQAHGQVVFVALKAGAETVRFRPSPETRLRRGDVLVVAGGRQAIGRLQDDALAPRRAA